MRLTTEDKAELDRLVDRARGVVETLRYAPSARAARALAEPDAGAVLQQLLVWQQTSAVES